MCFYCDVWISRMDSFKFADLINNFLQWIRLLPLRHILIWKRLVPVHGDTHRQVHYHPDTPHRVHPIHGTHHWVPPDMQCPQGSIDLVLWILILVRFQKLHIISPHPSRLVKVVSEQCTRPSYLLATGLLWSEQKRYETTSNCRLCISMHLWYFSFQRPGFFCWMSLPQTWVWAWGLTMSSYLISHECIVSFYGLCLIGSTCHSLE